MNQGTLSYSSVQPLFTFHRNCCIFNASSWNINRWGLFCLFWKLALSKQIFSSFNLRRGCIIWNQVISKKWLFHEKILPVYYPVEFFELNSKTIYYIEEILFSTHVMNTWDIVKNLLGNNLITHMHCFSVLMYVSNLSSVGIIIYFQEFFFVTVDITSSYNSTRSRGELRTCSTQIKRAFFGKKKCVR